MKAVGLLPLLLLVGCNSMRYIEMVNNTTDTVRFVWHLNEDSLMHNPFLLSNSKELLFTLAPPKTPSIKMSFGEGNWRPREVQKLVGFLTALEIQSPRQTLTLDSLPLLREFLLARRKGTGGMRIEISVPQPPGKK